MKIIITTTTTIPTKMTKLTTMREIAQPENSLAPSERLVLECKVIVPNGCTIKAPVDDWVVVGVDVWVAARIDVRPAVLLGKFPSVK
jgi:hypothetical protein